MKIALQTTASSLIGLLTFGVVLFVPAGTLHYWQGWAFIAVFTVTTVLPSIHLARHHPDTLQRRMNAGPSAETRPAQRIIICAIVAMTFGTLILSAFDHRFGWAPVPPAVSVLGLALVAAGLGAAQLVVIQNSYAAANITVEVDQPLVSTGLYGVVRHPMYSGLLVMMVGTPLALDSLWGLLGVIVSLPVLAARILDEEKLLDEQLAGYPDYRVQVPYRLVPHVW